MDDQTATVLIVSLVVLCILGGGALVVYHEMQESEFEKCSEVCGSNIMDDTLEIQCISSCLPLAECNTPIIFEERHNLDPEVKGGWAEW